MNNLKKVGLSALAGSLAMFSANAVDYAVSGDAQVVYSTAQGNENGAEASNGKGFGVDTDIYFNASGELDNGWTVSVFTALDLEQSNTATSGGINSSAQMTIGMGSLGTVQFNDVFGSAATSIDDVLPKAYEETWDHGIGTASFHTFGSNLNKGSVSYKTPSFELPFGVTVSGTADYDPNSGVEAATPGGVGGDAASAEGFTVKLAHESGLTIGGGSESTGNTDAGKGAKNATGYALYSNGGLQVGYQEFYANAAITEKGTTTRGVDSEGEGYALAYTAGDMTFSYSKSNETTLANGATAALEEEEFSAIQAAYNLGGMTIAASLYEADNLDGVAAKKYEETEISLSFAF
jgi:outer membrane protein OmpU